MASLHADERAYGVNVSAEIWPAANGMSEEYKAAIIDISRDMVPTLSISISSADEFYDLRDAILTTGKTLGWIAL